MHSARGETRGTARYVQALLQHWPFILGTVILAVGAASAFLLAAEKRYQARADVLVTPVPAVDESFVGLPVLRESGESRSVLTVARLVRSPQVAEQVRRRLQTRLNRDELLERIQVRPQAQSNIVTIQAEFGTAEGAAVLANTFARTLIDQRTAMFQRELRDLIPRIAARLAELRGDPRGAEALALGQRLGDLRSLVGARDPTLRVSSAAVPPLEAAWPKPVLSLVVALLAGALLGVGVAVGLEMLNPLVLKEQDLLDQGVPILARVPRISARRLRRLATHARPLPPQALDGYRVLRANLVAREAAHEPPTILVTAPSEREEASTVAAGMAIAFASAGIRVLLVDVDLRRLRVAEFFDGEPAGAEDVVSTAYEDLRLLRPEAYEASLLDLELNRLEALVAHVGGDADVVIVHAPPPLEAAETLLLADSADAVVVAARLGATRQDRVADLVRMLTGRGVTSLGFLVTVRQASRRASSAGVHSQSHRESLTTRG